MVGVGHQNPAVNGPKPFGPDSSGGELSDAQMFAILEERGYKRWEIAKLDRGYVSRIVGYPRDNKGRVEPENAPPRPPTEDRWKKYRDTMRQHGWPEWRIEEWIIAIQQAQQQESVQMAREQEDRYGTQPYGTGHG